MIIFSEDEDENAVTMPLLSTAEPNSSNHKASIPSNSSPNIEIAEESMSAKENNTATPLIVPLDQNVAKISALNFSASCSTNTTPTRQTAIDTAESSPKSSLNAVADTDSNIIQPTSPKVANSCDQDKSTAATAANIAIMSTPIKERLRSHGKGLQTSTFVPPKIKKRTAKVKVSMNILFFLLI